MTASLHVVDRVRANPLDLVERFASANDWPFERRDRNEIALEAPGRWCHYSLHFAWRAKPGALHFTCAFTGRVPTQRKTHVHELLALANERLWLGHFGLWSEEGMTLFRHVLPLRGAGGATMGQIEDLVDTALAECERFYPAFQFVIWGGKTAPDALTASLLETEGEA